MNFAKLGAILLLCVLCISYLEHISVVAESSEDLLQDSERTLSSFDDEDEAESRTLAGYKKYGYRKRHYSYGHKKKYSGYRYKYGRKLEGTYHEKTCNCQPGYVYSHGYIKITKQDDPDVCCQFCYKKGFNFSEYDVKANKCTCVEYGDIKYDYYSDKFFACKFG